MKTLGLSTIFIAFLFILFAALISCKNNKTGFSQNKKSNIEFGFLILDSYYSFKNNVRKRNNTTQSSIQKIEELLECIPENNTYFKHLIENKNVLISITQSKIELFSIFFTDNNPQQFFVQKKISISNQIEYKDTVQFFKPPDCSKTQKHILDTIRLILKEDFKIFKKENSHFFVDYIYVYFTIEYDSINNYYNYSYDQSLDYNQELIVVQSKPKLHKFFMANNIKRLSIRVKVPKESEIPPPIFF